MRNVVLALASCLVLTGFAREFVLASPQAKARVVVAGGEEGFVLRAVEDFRSDVRKIAGVELERVRGESPRAGDVFVRTESGPAESYRVETKDGVLRFCGADARGTMFAIYDFCENFLGVDPLYFWSGVPHPKRARLAWPSVGIRRGPPSFRYRGWFLNDEDFINAWRPWAGRRAVSKKVSSGITIIEQVMNVRTLEDVLESIVRSRMNLLIPSSYIDPFDPVEADILDRIAARGVFVTQHHHDPLGLSGFMFDNETRGTGKLYSYHSSPKELEALWRRAAAVYARHPNVLWQIGMRGHNDSPMWNSDPTVPRTDEGRAAIISAAMRKQVEVLDALGVPKEGRCVTATLWSEGARFNRKGLLDFPKGTTVVFSDNCPGWRWSEDFHMTPRKPDLSYGVYYHHQLMTEGPHVCTMISADRTCRLMREAYDSGANAYAVFNVGNVREFCYGIDASAKMTWDIGAYDPSAWQRAWIARGAGDAEASAWSAALNGYFASFAVDPRTGLPEFLDGLINFRRYRHVVCDIIALRAGRRPAVDIDAGVRDRLAAQLDGFSRAFDAVLRLQTLAPSERRAFVDDQLVYPVKVMRAITDAYAELVAARLAAAEGNWASCHRLLVASRTKLDAVIALEGERNLGKWKGWTNPTIHQRIDWRKDLPLLERAIGATVLRP